VSNTKTSRSDGVKYVKHVKALRGIINIYIPVYHNYGSEFWKISAVYKQGHHQQVALIFEYKRTATCLGYCP
jgi:ADP-dependent phosphofructokinase/glucokinase